MAFQQRLMCIIKVMMSLRERNSLHKLCVIMLPNQSVKGK